MERTKSLKHDAIIKVDPLSNSPKRKTQKNTQDGQFLTGIL